MLNAMAEEIERLGSMTVSAPLMLVSDTTGVNIGVGDLGSGMALRPVRLLADGFAGELVDGVEVEWSTWLDLDPQVDIEDIQFHAAGVNIWSGFAFEGDIVLVAEKAGEYFAVGSGHQILAGTPDSNIAPGDAGYFTTDASSSPVTVTNDYETATMTAGYVWKIYFDDSAPGWRPLTGDCPASASPS